MPPAPENQFALYLSHSWRLRDVELNAKVWGELGAWCELLIDAPEEPGADPPYHINRIEELLRRTDVFASVLTHREPKPGEFEGQDAKLRCSPYCLFEIRLAERGDIPRLILYDRTTGFRPPAAQRDWEAYVPFDRGLRESLPDESQWVKVLEPRIRRWQEWIGDHRRPASYVQSMSAVILVNLETQAALSETIADCLRDGGYEPVRPDVRQLRSSTVLRQLREAGLVIVDFSACTPALEQMYAAAHGQCTPAIRLMAHDSERKLPWILSGDPGGYQLDMVRWQNVEEVPALVKPRIASMFRLSKALSDTKGHDYLQSKRYAPFFVFLSHTLKPPHRTLVERIYAKLAERQVTPFEYHEVNTAGIDWRQALNESLTKTTHFVALLSDGYEVSQTCTYEMDQILARGAQVTILPFMAGGRSIPHPKLTNMHNTLLDGADIDRDAATVVEQIMTSLEQAAKKLAGG